MMLKVGFRNSKKIQINTQRKWTLSSQIELGAEIVIFSIWPSFKRKRLLLQGSKYENWLKWINVIDKNLISLVIQSSIGIKLAAREVEHARIEGLSFEWRSFSIPGLFECIHLRLFFRCWETHLLPLLLIHYLPDSSFCLTIEILKRFGVVDLGSIDFWISSEYSSPYLFLSFLQIQVNVKFATNLLNFPVWFRCINLFNKFSFNKHFTCLFFNRNPIRLEIYFELYRLLSTIFAVISGLISMLTSTSLISWLQVYFSFLPPL